MGSSALQTSATPTEDVWFEEICWRADRCDAALRELHAAAEAGDLARALRACERLQFCGWLMGRLTRKASRAGLVF